MNKIIENMFLLLFKVLPLKKKVVFRSFNGHYSDSPKSISEAMHEVYSDIKIVWLVDKSRLKTLPFYVKGIDINSYKSVYHLSTAAAFVDNNYGRKGIVITKDNNHIAIAKVLSKLNSRKNQINLSTWHGTPIKRIGNDQPGSTGVDFITPPLIFVHPNKHTMNVIDNITFHRARNKLSGLPRNDILFQVVKRKEIKRRLGIPKEKRVILYAPTFRSDGYDTDNRNVERSGLAQLKEIDFDKLLKKMSDRFGGDDWIFIGRFHYFVEKEISWDDLENRYPGKVFNGNLYDDMSEYLAITDVLITDCSSCMFDFAVTYRPIFLFFPDVDYYRGIERGFYFELGILPFPCAKKFDELIAKIDSFDDDQYRKSIDNMNKMLIAADD